MSGVDDGRPLVEELFIKQMPGNQLELTIAQGIRQIILARIDGQISLPIPIIIDGPDGKPASPDHQDLRQAAFKYLGLGIFIPELDFSRSTQQHLVTGSKYFPTIGHCYVTLHATQQTDGHVRYELRDHGVEKS